MTLTCHHLAHKSVRLISHPLQGCKGLVPIAACIVQEAKHTMGKLPVYHRDDA